MEKRTWKNCGTSEDVQRVPKSVRSLGSLKVSELPDEPSGSMAKSHSLQRSNAEGTAGKSKRMCRDARSRGDIPVHSKKGVAPGSFLRSLSGKKTLEAGWGAVWRLRTGLPSDLHMLGDSGHTHEQYRKWKLHS